MAALKLNWFKFKNAYGDFLKVLIGILLFEFLIIYIQQDGLMENFETTRMTLFLLLFSSSLLIMVQNSIYISKERAILERDFFSTLSRIQYGGATLLFNLFFALVETLIFIIGYHVTFQFFDIEVMTSGSYLSSFNLEMGITVFLTFICSHVVALLISALVGSSEITSVILAVVVGIMQFSLAGTILELPEAMEKVPNFIFLGYSHKLLGMAHDLENLPSALEELTIPVDEASLAPFEASNGVIIKDWTFLLIHLLVYIILFLVVLRKRTKK